MNNNFNRSGQNKKFENRSGNKKSIFDDSLKQKSIKEITSTNYDYGVIINKIRTTTTQIRQLLSNSVVVRNKIEMSVIHDNLKQNDNLTDELKWEVEYLLIKFIYQCGRDESVSKFNDEFKIATILNKINTPAEFYTYYRYLEKIVAYVKYYKQ